MAKRIHWKRSGRVHFGFNLIENNFKKLIKNTPKSKKKFLIRICIKKAELSGIIN
jgi:hypothetical protein